MTQQHYKLGEFAKLINVSVKTLQRWDRENILKSFRFPSGRRYYTYDQYLEIQNKNNSTEEDKIFKGAKMNRFQIEKLYEVNSLNDYRLKTPVDLIKTHGIDYIEVDGFSRLSDENKLLFGKFIVNFMNGLGLESRATLIPRGVYYVEDFDYIVKENPDDEYWQVAGGVVMVLDKNGLKTIHRTWKDEDYAHLEMTESKHKTYLRFEYEHQDRQEWLHIIDEKTWY